MGKKRKIALYGLLHLAVLFTIIYLAMNTLFAQTSTIEIQFPLSQEYETQITQINYSLDSQINFSNCWAIIQEEQTPILQAGELITNLSSIQGTNNWLLICNDTQSNLYQKEIIFSSNFLQNESSENETIENQTPEPTNQSLELEIISPINSLYNSSQLLLQINFSNNTNKWSYEIVDLETKELNSTAKEINLTKLNTGNYTLIVTIFDEFENTKNQTIEFEIAFNDLDRDSILDSEDNLILSKELIEANFDLIIKVNGEEQIPQLLNENETLIEFYDSSSLFLSFLINDSNQTINLENLSLEKFDSSFSVKGFEFIQKTYFRQLSGDFIKICLTTSEEISGLEITNTCSKENEIDFRDCYYDEEYAYQGITCKYVNDIFEFEGNFSNLKAKLIYEQEDDDEDEEEEEDEKKVKEEDSFQDVFFDEVKTTTESSLELNSNNVSENDSIQELIENNENIDSSRTFATGRVIETLEKFYISTDKKWIIITLLCLGIIGVFSFIGFRKKKTKISSLKTKNFDEKFKAK